MDIAAFDQVSYAAAFVTGLLGGVHCVGMCGALVGALTMGVDPAARRTTSSLLPYLLGYNAGRILSYTLAGALAGGVGWVATHLGAVHELRLGLHLLAALFMLALGLYLAGWWRGLAYVESAGASVWRRIEPVARRFVPVRSPTQAVVAGVLWGWLPCGLVYTIVIWAIASGGVVQGALLMLSFGLGTLPNLLAMGVFAARLARFTRQPMVRLAAGLLIMAYGMYWLFKVGYALYTL